MSNDLEKRVAAIEKRLHIYNKRAIAWHKRFDEGHRKFWKLSDERINKIDRNVIALVVAYAVICLLQYFAR